MQDYAEAVAAAREDRKLDPWTLERVDEVLRAEGLALYVGDDGQLGVTLAVAFPVTFRSAFDAMTKFAITVTDHGGRTVATIDAD